MTAPSLSVSEPKKGTSAGTHPLVNRLGPHTKTAPRRYSILGCPNALRPAMLTFAGAYP